jgi:hypothetical protein
MEDGIIETLHTQWRMAKAEYQKRCEAAHFLEAAKRVEECRMFKGTETFPELVALFTSPQGIEFCIANSFPSLAALRLFKKEQPEKYGIYIDAGSITLTDPECAILIGRTNATVKCSTCARHKVVTMHGAVATILASRWTVVRAIAAPGSSIIRRTKDYAIIL